MPALPTPSIVSGSYNTDDEVVLQYGITATTTVLDNYVGEVRIITFDTLVPRATDNSVMTLTDIRSAMIDSTADALITASNTIDSTSTAWTNAIRFEQDTDGTDYTSAFHSTTPAKIYLYRFDLPADNDGILATVTMANSTLEEKYAVAVFRVFVPA